MKSRSILLSLMTALGLGLTACPEPPSTSGGPGPGNNNAGAPSGAEQPTAPGGGPSAGGPGGPGGGGAPMGAVDPQFSQEDLAGQEDTVTFTGTLKCEDSEGPFVVHVFPPPPGAGGEGGGEGGEGGAKPPGPITELKIKAPGEFSLLLPKGDEGVMVLGFADSDDDGVPGPEEGIFFLNDEEPVERSADMADLVLDCSAVATPRDPPETNKPAEGGPTPESERPAPAEGQPPAEGGAAE